MPRKRVLKGAKLVFNGTVVDCVVLNITERGARVSMGAPMPLPAEATLHLSGGAVYRGRQRWRRGQDAGFEFADAPALSADAAGRALPIYEALRGAAPDGALDRLRAERCFDDPALSELAQRLGEAHAALATALRERAALA